MLENLPELPWNIILPLIVLNFILMLIALISLAKAEQTNGPKWMWVLIIIFCNLLGPIAFFIIGRRND